MGLNLLSCCGSGSSVYSPIEDLMDLIDRDCSPFSPGLHRESRDERHSSERRLEKTSGNALQDTSNTFTPHSPQRVSVIVPGGVSDGQTIYVSYLDENNKPKTLAASVPPNSYPGMQFFVEVPPPTTKHIIPQTEDTEDAH